MFRSTAQIFAVQLGVLRSHQYWHSMVRLLLSCLRYRLLDKLVEVARSTESGSKLVHGRQELIGRYSQGLVPAGRV